jgi:ferric-dicitrate binding protein FerR (iron transport regulator)
MTMPELPAHDVDYLRIAEYLNGECSPAEAARLESELATNESLQFAAQLLQLALSAPAPSAAPDTDGALADLARRTGDPAQPRSWFRRGLKRIEILVGLAAVLMFGWVNYRILTPVVAAHAYERYEAPMESRRTVRLPDGSRATLEPGARLTYRASYFRPPRVLTLEGEARFQARLDVEHPFEVRANGVLAVAIGTVFTVRANPWEPTVHISVDEGVVDVWPDTTRIHPRQIVVAGGAVDVTPITAGSDHR